jgi:hypothetical protein
MLEIAIAIYALILPSAIQSVSGWMEVLAANLTVMQWYLLQGAEAFCLLIMPAFGMGIGFALMLKVIEDSPISLAKLYGVNTIGGVVGAIYPLWSLSAIGWTNSVRSMAFLGLIVGGATLLLSRLIRPKQEHEQKVTTDAIPEFKALIIYAGIGASSIMLEIGWVRLYGMIMLRTEYVLGVILAVFLLGIAICCRGWCTDKYVVTAIRICMGGSK